MDGNAVAKLLLIILITFWQRLKLAVIASSQTNSASIKFLNGMSYKRAMQGCCPMIKCPDKICLQ
ncbi:MAG: hypothetical protein JWP81_3547 [Ferruginibacter sp.]|nr:hypothetical protein [Ferruginibacter sp.]